MEVSHQSHAPTVLHQILLLTEQEAGGAWTWFGHFGEETNLLPPLEFEPQIVQLKV